MSEFLNRATESLGSTVLPQNRQTFTFMVAIAPLYDCSIRSIHAVCARECEPRSERGSPDTTSVNLLRGMNTCDLYFYGHFYGEIYGKRGACACSVYQAFLSPPLEGLGTRLHLCSLLKPCLSQSQRLPGSVDLPNTAETSAFWVILNTNGNRQYVAMSVTTTKIDTTCELGFFSKTHE